MVIAAAACILPAGTSHSGIVEGAWHRIFTFGTVAPSARSGHTAIYDPVHDRMIVFGGYAGATTFNDVWELTLGSSPEWHQLSPTGGPPPVRRFHTAVYDSDQQRMIVYGGNEAMTLLGDVWALSLDGPPAWTQLSPAGAPPAPRMRHAAIYDPGGNRMIAYGGATNFSDENSELWELSLAGGGMWTMLAGWRSLQDHSAVHDPLGDRMVVFGGHADVPENTVYFRDLSGGMSWSTPTTVGAIPNSFVRHAAVMDAANNRMLVFGGGYCFITGEMSTWELDLSGTPTWTQFIPAGEEPEARTGLTAVLDENSDRVIVFGGTDCTSLFGEVWALDLTTNTDVGPPEADHRVQLSAVWPNPARHDASARLVVSERTGIRLEVHDLQGRLVRVLASGVIYPGAHAFNWDLRTSAGHRVASGLYFLEVVTERQRLSRNLLVLQ